MGRFHMSFPRRVNCELIATKFAPVPKTTIVQTFFPLDEQVMPDIYSAMDEYAELTGGCVHFRSRIESDGINFVIITSALSGCFAKIGHAVRYGHPVSAKMMYSL